MRKWISSVAILLFLVSITIVAERNVLIDFNVLDNTGLDIVKVAGPNAYITPKTAEEKEKLIISLEPENWEVILSPSSRTVENIRNSFTRTVTVNAGDYAGQKVLGARIHFPTARYNAWAKIVPPYEIPTYEATSDTDTIGDKYVGKGVLRNVGTIKTVFVTVCGVNFPHSLTIRLKNHNDETIDFFIGYLDFNGFKRIIVSNPNYISDVRKRSLQKFPLYPVEEPSIKFDSFIIYRHGDQIGGDFVIYLKSVEMIYDKAVYKTDQEIDHEAIWHILADRREAKKRAEAARVGIIQLLQYEERLKLATESDQDQTTPTK